MLHSIASLPASSTVPADASANPDLEISGNDKRTEYNPSQALKPVTEIQATRAKPDGGRPVKETENTYMQWLLERAQRM
jgi:hypothetical protein